MLTCSPSTEMKISRMPQSSADVRSTVMLET
jgi:hypothetical protein